MSARVPIPGLRFASYAVLLVALFMIGLLTHAQTGAPGSPEACYDLSWHTVDAGARPSAVAEGTAWAALSVSPTPSCSPEATTRWAAASGAAERRGTRSSCR
jgi:hypothetical protein